jgi:proteasome-associated ATPase
VGEEKQKGDESGEKINELEKTVNNLRFENQDLEYKLRVSSSKVAEYEETIKKVKSPPLLYAYILRLSGEDLTETQAAVARGSDIIKVSLGTVDKKKLRLGQYVWVHPQSYAIIEASGEFQLGTIAKVVDIMDCRLVISVQGETETRVISCLKDVASHLKPGFQLTVLPPTMEILEVMPNTEVKALLLGQKPNVKYSQIGGLSHVIERIKDTIVLPYKEAKLFKKVGLTPPRGILLYGPPGCGKTLLVKAVATENDLTFFNVSIADILSKWVGESERIIKELFRQAKERKPSIIFFDEIEALFTVRGLLDTSGVHKNIIAQILAEMDGLVNLQDVFVIGATNRPDLLDPALMRPGRFDEIIDIPRPDRDSAGEILKIYLPDDIPLAVDYLKGFSKRKDAMESMRNFVLDEIFGDDKWIRVKIGPDSEDTLKALKRKDVVSGAIIEAITRTAKKNYIKRVAGKGKKERESDGISPGDVAFAVEEECNEHVITDFHVLEKRQRETKKRVSVDPMIS